MAYPLYEETQRNSPEPVQYYPEEYVYPDLYHKFAEAKATPAPNQSIKKGKRASATISYLNERKCPIYVHQYNKGHNASTFNNYSGKTILKPQADKKIPPKAKKIPGYPSTKSVLDQLEETYWATWKPNKETVATMPKKNRVQNDKISKIKDFGDVPDSVSNYLSSSEYETCTVPTLVDESEYEKFNNSYQTVINMQDLYENNKKTIKLKTTHTQEIQTETVSLVLPKIEEHVENEEATKKETAVTIEVDKTDKEMEENEKPTEKNTDEGASQEVPEGEKSKLLKHTDSFIINKKKQGEAKERFQQPRCIRLYRKPGISTSFIRGGTYPLKSCLKREPVPKGNFRLGAPGSPLFVSTSSFYKKSKK